MGRNSRAKKPKGRNVVMTKGEVETIKRNATDDAVTKALLLIICAMADELNTIADTNLPEDFIERLARRTERYAENLNAHLFDMRDLGESIFKQTGVDWRKW